ncbi:MAG: hypothetical protein ACRC0V_10835, partial [Fusobacteriaceae bacterium]
MKKRSRVKSNVERDFTDKILKVLSKSPNKEFDFKQLATKFDITDTKSRNQLIKDLKILASTKVISEAEPGQYFIKAENEAYYEGTIDMTSKRSAYLVCPDVEVDVFIPFSNLNHSLDGDRVRVYVYNRRKSAKPEGEVVEVL